MSSLEHTHTYVKYKRRPGYWRCAHPECTHVLDAEAVKGKLTICNSCGLNTFILTREDMRRTRPLCLSCSNTKKGKAFRTVQGMIESKLDIDPGETFE